MSTHRVTEKIKSSEGDWDLVIPHKGILTASGNWEEWK